ncbi:DUF397 domain-containing protein [Actinomadura fibrosa]|uniref:DUF397 domain-containing protein n=1 Tax=Actinomadura fibrosa TaxID=111802 RepID=A0ABW2XNE5_9ACTN
MIWRKSSRSSGGGQNCVEVANGTGVVLVRDSKDPGGPLQVMSAAGFGELVGRIKRGALDL